MKAITKTSTPKNLTIVVLFLLLAGVPWQLWFDAGISLTNQLALPSLQHLLGTDNLGRDLLVRFSQAVTDGIIPLWSSVVAGFTLGLVTGITHILSAGNNTLGLGWRIFHLATTGIVGIPVGVMAFAVAVTSEKSGLAPIMLPLAAIFAIRTYHDLLALYHHDERLGYWQANQCLGGSPCYRLWHYGIKTAWRSRLLDNLGFQLKVAVTIEVALSYLGFGIQEPQASLGNILASHMDTYLKGDPWILLATVASLALTAAFPASLLQLLHGGLLAIKKRTAHRELGLERLSLYKTSP